MLIADLLCVGHCKGNCGAKIKVPQLCYCCSCFIHYVMSDSLASPWTVAHQSPLSIDFPGENTGLGCHFLLQGNFLTW